MVDSYPKWFTTTLTIALSALSALSASTAISFYFYRKKSKELGSKIQALESSLNSSLQKCASERQGRIRAQQDLRKGLAEPKSENVENMSYPLIPIGFVQSCFSTRNGTPRQPLIVPLARACLHFNVARVPPASLEGLAEYSHCWIIYVFHLNTDLDKLWKQPSRSKFKAKVRVPRLKGGRMGVFATRSPHRPCPIGLTVAKVEAVRGSMVLLSGVDLVDGTPILDIKPYLPYCDSIEGAVVPEWEDKLLAVGSISFSDGFSSSLADCWEILGKKSLYASPEELQSLIKQVLSWDIRSASQRDQPHISRNKAENEATCPDSCLNECDEEGFARGSNDNEPDDNVKYHLMLEGFDVSYRIDNNSSVVVERVEVSCGVANGNQKCCNYAIWRDEVESI